MVESNPGVGLYVANTELWAAASTGRPDNGMHFNGPSAMAANGGNPVLLELASPYYDGSSIPHPAFSDERILMNSTFYKGQYPQAFNGIETGGLPRPRLHAVWNRLQCS